MHKQSSRSEWANENQQKTSGKKKKKKAGEMRENMKTKRKNKKSQIRWSPWQMLRASGTAAALRVAFEVLGHKRLNQVWCRGGSSRVCVRVCSCRRQDLTSSFKTCMWWRRHTEVSRLFRFFSFLLLYSYRISPYSQLWFLFFLLLVLVALWKKKVTFFFCTNRIVLFFFQLFLFFSEKTNICFFFFFNSPFAQ